MRNKFIATLLNFISMNLNLFAIEGKIMVLISSQDEIYT